jgi:predicted alpha/beta hydrolase family esterase
MDELQVLILPGWQDSGPEHWQSRWERHHGFTRVQQDDWMWPRRGDWMARLEDVVLSRRGPLLLAAHSLGCQLVAAWAAHSQHAHRVAGALLVAPPDVEREDMPPNLYSWRPIVRRRLPFAALAVVSSNDPYCTPARASAMVQDWGARQLGVGAAGHINGESGLGDWVQGLELLRQVAVTGGLSPTMTPW